MTSLRTVAGPGSVRAYATRLGENPGAPVSVKRLVSADLLQRGWERYGGAKGPGTALTDVAPARGTYGRRYSAGTLRLVADDVQLEGQKAYRAHLIVAGVFCIARAKTDQVGGPSSEPYLIATVVDPTMVKGEAKAILVGGEAASDIDGGDWIGYGEEIWTGANPGELQVQLVMWEEDGGQSAEARKKVETAINDSIQVASIIFPVVGIVRSALGKIGDRFISSMARLLKEPFKDDYIGQNTASLGYEEFFANPPEVKTFKGAKYRITVPVDGGKAGQYEVYLHWTVEESRIPRK